MKRPDAVAEKTAELRIMPDEELAKEAFYCRRFMRRAPTDWWNWRWWDLIKVECERRGKPSIATEADAREVEENRAAREMNRR